MKRAWLLALGLCWSACAEAERRPQWLIHVGTDAAVPGFGDRVRVDVLDTEGSPCTECQRFFDAAELPLSFGVEPSGAPLRVRISLFRAAVTGSDGLPLEPIIELLAALPELGEGEMSLVAPLSMSCFGKGSEVSSDESCDPATGTRAAGLLLEPGTELDLPVPGSFGGQPASCGGGEPGMVCIPGAVYLFGNPSFVPMGPDFDPVPEQLVRVPSVLLDLDEMTVAEMRNIVDEHSVAAPLEWSEDDPHCTYTGAPTEGDGLPVNCIGRDAAADACAAIGKRLPSEAEWELAASGPLDAPYPWVLDDFSNESLCATAVLARPTLSEWLKEGSRVCKRIDDAIPEGLQAVAETRDEGHFGLRNLGGNVAEWVADDHAALADDACWGSSLVLRDDPQCISSSSDGVIKGGDYVFFTYNSHSFYRRPVPKSSKRHFIGFRCAKDLP